jgi:hypothetical protein
MRTVVGRSVPRLPWLCDCGRKHARVPIETDSCDIFIASGEPQFEQLLALLPMLRPHGRVHVCSSFLTDAQLAVLDPQVDVVHFPRHSEDAYENFNLFCIRDINRVATAPWFIKIDTDVQLSRDWFDYVAECLDTLPDPVLFGTHGGTNWIDYHISGELVRHHFGRDLRVRKELKVNGSFYVGNTHFFREHDAEMQLLHDFIYAFADGRRVRPSHVQGDGFENEVRSTVLVQMRGSCAWRQGQAIEDSQRSLLVHVVGAGDRLFVRDAGARIFLPDKAVPPPRRRLARKWLYSHLGIPDRSRKTR